MAWEKSVDALHRELAYRILASTVPSFSELDSEHIGDEQVLYVSAHNESDFRISLRFPLGNSGPVTIDGRSYFHQAEESLAMRMALAETAQVITGKPAYVRIKRPDIDRLDDAGRINLGAALTRPQELRLSPEKILPKDHFYKQNNI